MAYVKIGVGGPVGSGKTEPQKKTGNDSLNVKNIKIKLDIARLCCIIQS